MVVIQESHGWSMKFRDCVWTGGDAAANGSPTEVVVEIDDEEPDLIVTAAGGSCRHCLIGVLCLISS